LLKEILCQGKERREVADDEDEQQPEKREGARDLVVERRHFGGRAASPKFFRTAWYVSSRGGIASRSQHSLRRRGRDLEDRGHEQLGVGEAHPLLDLVAELQDHCKQGSAPYKYPREIEFVAELPKTISGKIRWVELREREITISNSADPG
jgi:acyl-CoA synthetase (AMP-forming)/AMP-acid ligase II